MSSIISPLVITAAGAMAFATGADAAGGCGRGWHPDRWGHCVRNAAYVDPRACGYYSHWSNYWGRCVHN